MATFSHVSAGYSGTDDGGDLTARRYMYKPVAIAMMPFSQS